MRDDGLAALVRLRAQQTRDAEFVVREAASVRQGATEVANRAAAAVRAEEPDGVPVTYGTWLAEQMAKRQEARAAEASAAAREHAARQALVEARRAERIIEILREARAEDADRRARRREAALLDDIAARLGRRRN